MGGIGKVLIALIMLFPVGNAAAGDDRDWMHAPQIDRKQFADELDRIYALSPEDARKEAADITADLQGATGEGALAGRMALALALERAEDSGGALQIYKELSAQQEGTPFRESANFRQNTLNDQTKPLEEKAKKLKSIIEESDAEGWFLVSGRWTWTSKHTAARKALVELNSDSLSFRIFSFITDNSPLKGSLQCLGLLLVLSIGAKILELPLLVKSAQAQGRMQSIQPEIQRIQSTYAGDPTEAQKQLWQLYKQRGVNFKAGCMMVVADLIFVIWALIALRDYAPQMVLNGAQLLWINDITKPNVGILVVFVVVSAFVAAVTIQTGQKAQIIGGSIFSSIVFCLIAYFWDWPAYVFVYWTLLSIVGFVLNILLWPVRSAAAHSAR